MKSSVSTVNFSFSPLGLYSLFPSDRLFIFDFEQSGIHLDEQKREEFVRISADLKR